MGAFPGNEILHCGFGGEAERLTKLICELEQIHAQLVEFERKFTPQINKVHTAYEASARNLIHYIAVRQRDIKNIQEELASLGLSSLGRAESHVMSTLTAVLAMLHKANGTQFKLPPAQKKPVAYMEGETLIETHAESLLGTPPKDRKVRIMVTMPSEAAGDYRLVQGLVRGGMDCARINCAHDGPEEWARMAENIRGASRELARPCRVMMDLAGPKLRTGEIEAGPKVLKLRPKRNVLGKVVEPWRIMLVPGAVRAEPGRQLASVEVTPVLLKRIRKGSEVHFTDSRGKSRKMRILSMDGEGATAECGRTAYLTPGIQLYVIKKDAGGEPQRMRAGAIGDIPATVKPLMLSVGDTLLLTADQSPGRAAVRDEEGKVVETARIPCSMPGIFSDLRPGERVWMDDGKIGGVIERASPEDVLVRIVRAKPGGSKLAAEKGINLPDSNLKIKGLTPEDIGNIALIARCADTVALSFLRTPQDVTELQQQLEKHGARNMGVVLKIETRQALSNLPSILLAAMRSFPVGVMIARGDLAVECGFELLAEAQEEILLLCEASHVPVIWATQVLENLNKEGLPSRAEISDAAMSVRAECVMLNKGPHITETLKMLHGILKSMEGRQKKKRTYLKKLAYPTFER